jgi:hypothetical protein
MHTKRMCNLILLKWITSGNEFEIYMNQMKSNIFWWQMWSENTKNLLKIEHYLGTNFACVKEIWIFVRVRQYYQYRDNALSTWDRRDTEIDISWFQNWIFLQKFPLLKIIEISFH